MLMFIREFRHQSAYGALRGAYAYDRDGELYAFIHQFVHVRGAQRQVNYRLKATDLDDTLLKNAFDSVVRTEAQKPS